MFLFYVKEQFLPPVERKGEPPAQPQHDGFFESPKGAGEKNSIPQELKKMIGAIDQKIKKLEKVMKEFSGGTEAAKQIGKLIGDLNAAKSILQAHIGNNDVSQEKFSELQGIYNHYLAECNRLEKLHKPNLANYRIRVNGQNKALEEKKMAPTNEFIRRQAELYLNEHPGAKKTPAQLEKLFLSFHMEKLEGEAKRIAENTAKPDKEAIRNHFLVNPLSLYSETADVSKLQFAPSEDGKTVTFTNKQRQQITYGEENRTITVKNPSFAEVLYGDILSGIINTAPLAEKVKNGLPITKEDLDFVAMISILPALPFANLLLPKLELNHMFNEYIADGKITEDEARMLNDFREGMPDMYLLYGMLTLATVAPAALQTGPKLAAMREASFKRDFIRGLYKNNYEIEHNLVKKYGTEVPESKIRIAALEKTKTDLARVFTEPEFSDFRNIKPNDLWTGKADKLRKRVYGKLFSKRLGESVPYDKGMEIKGVKFTVENKTPGAMEISNYDFYQSIKTAADHYVSIGEFNNAAEVYIGASEKFKSLRRFELLQNAADIYAKNGDYRKAAVIFRDSAVSKSTAPMDRYLYCSKSADYYALDGDFEIATELYKQAGELSEDKVIRAKMLRKAVEMFDQRIIYFKDAGQTVPENLITERKQLLVDAKKYGCDVKKSADALYNKFANKEVQAIIPDIKNGKIKLEGELKTAYESISLNDFKGRVNFIINEYLPKSIPAEITESFNEILVATTQDEFMAAINKFTRSIASHSISTAQKQFLLNGVCEKIGVEPVNIVLHAPSELKGDIWFIIKPDISNMTSQILTNYSDAKRLYLLRDAFSTYVLDLKESTILGIHEPYSTTLSRTLINSEGDVLSSVKAIIDDAKVYAKSFCVNNTGADEYKVLIDRITQLVSEKRASDPLFSKKCNEILEDLISKGVIESDLSGIPHIVIIDSGRETFCPFYCGLLKSEYGEKIVVDAFYYQTTIASLPNSGGINYFQMEKIGEYYSFMGPENMEFNEFNPVNVQQQRDSFWNLLNILDTKPNVTIPAK